MRIDEGTEPEVHADRDDVHQVEDTIREVEKDPQRDGAGGCRSELPVHPQPASVHAREHVGIEIAPEGLEAGVLVVDRGHGVDHQGRLGILRGGVVFPGCGEAA
jgi:hypothetical protein